MCRSCCSILSAYNGGMPDETIFCPECKSKVKVPDTLLGQPVTCPLCRHTFTAPIPGGGSVSPPSVLPAGPRTVEHGQEALPDASTVQAPAVSLAVVGVLGVVANFYRLMSTMALGPLGLEQQNQQVFAQLNMQPPAADPQMVFQATVFLQGFMVLFALGVVFGAWQMLRLSWYSLAVTGSILAMINIGECCCLLGLPVGIWSLVVLMRPEVRAAFQ